MKTLLKSIIALFVFSCLFLGCENPSGSEPVPKELSIYLGTAGDWETRVFVLTVQENLDSGIVAGSKRNGVSLASCPFPLKTPYPQLTENWTGSGSYYLFLTQMDSTATKIENIYLYTNGVTPNENLSNVPKYNITGKHRLDKWADFYKIADFVK
ncbi:hypothetical protein AGMMS50230_17580 [Spirochaetia bacterium]|nr:hypothetical protein AGMMS50230_17580 [Spirochaetia bacterium]